MAGAADRVRLYDLKPAVADVAAEVRAGLARPPRTIAPKFFYDDRGSRLFEDITRQPEYYPTDAELEILRAHSDDIRTLLGTDCLLVEYGSGSSLKISLLIEALRPRAYMPLDISKDALLGAAADLVARHDWLTVAAVCADYSRPLTLPWRPDDAPVAALFPGSSIGNFEPAGAARFLTQVATTLGAGGRLLVGIDRRKDPAVLERAYDDAAGVTAAFNRNVLVHLNRVLGGDADPEAFDHRAVWNAELGRVEMHLVARAPTTFRVGDTEVAMAAGETLHTENSYKYDPAEFSAMAEGAGFDVRAHWTDGDERFSVFVLEVRPAS